MPTASPIPVNPAVLVWARKESGYTVSRVSERMKVKEDRFLQWEQGGRNPTLKQVQELARIFHRPLSLFFLPNPPSVTPLGAEYRRLPGMAPGHESPEMRLAVRQMLIRRENAINLLGELGESILEFSLQAHLSEHPEAVAERLRSALKIDIQMQLKWQSEWQALNAWRDAVESLGVLVFQFSKVELDEVRGISLLRFPMPVVGVNSKEIPEPKGFTLIHEVVHLMLASGKEELPAIKEIRNDEQWSTVEQFAETVTSHTMVPETALAGIIRDQGFDADQWGLDEVRRLARRFRLSPLAMATRLRASGYMNWPTYWAWKRAWDEFVANLPPRKGGFATPVDKAVSRNGRSYSQLVLEAMNSNRLTPVEASHYLGLKFEHFGRLREKMLSRTWQDGSDG